MDKQIYKEIECAKEDLKVLISALKKLKERHEATGQLQNSLIMAHKYLRHADDCLDDISEGIVI